jgi:hypothetical protein
MPATIHCIVVDLARVGAGTENKKARSHEDAPAWAIALV